jgi:hypothetical protein
MILCTTSDDRSARVWSLAWEEEGESRPGLARWSTALLTPRHVLYGHVARVFRCQLHTLSAIIVNI